MRHAAILASAAVLALCAGSFGVQRLTAAPASFESLDALGEALFFDPNLSKTRSQSCASCHDPAYAFADPRGAASTGDDGSSLGDRNAPTVTYAAQVPALARDAEGRWRGGLFHDGRAVTLEEQAGGPPLNPIEMGMGDKSEVVARLRENPDYVAAFGTLFGPATLSDPEAGYAAMTRAIAAFERRPEFASFDSKYDRFLRGEAELTRQEELGRLLFFSQQFTNCNQCHQLQRSAVDPAETFSDYRFHNLGVPANAELRASNGAAAGFVDGGLMQNTHLTEDGSPADEGLRGAFRTPTLRNVAVTAPYMHNGAFEDLRTVILFYNSYNTRNAARKVNPETGAPFGPPEVPENLAPELTDGPALDDKRVDALVAFLRTLTDARYEELLAQ
ncbi:cytochrome-c peroxidase [Salipiger mangrovisoli]|uniref:Methylamine utilization protein MauG n=1 Tax=Salipiger mangrovisoli TaxID=2865933 RepID=A0ABR9WW40_9RHOB|nr:cytochrome c peroxidase [Salipiger mangrovisoli]MBE9635502.1 methylamine utilization protein MauG [Salipiger mangrovisoli]